MKPAVPAVLILLLAAACGKTEQNRDGDHRLVVLGPSLVEVIYASGLGDRVVGVDRFSRWPQAAAELPDVGGYSDPALETIASLTPTSIHISGESPMLSGYARELGIPCYSYDFNDLAGVYRSLDSLHARYGGEVLTFRDSIESTLDSISAFTRPLPSYSVLVVVYHELGSSSMTVAGGSTFYSDILHSMGCTVSAPEAASWPVVSAEGVLELDPDRVLCLYPGAGDSMATVEAEMEFWTELGYSDSSVHFLFQPWIMVPGARLPRIAEVICSCLY